MWVGQHNKPPLTTTGAVVKTLMRVPTVECNNLGITCKQRWHFATISLSSGTHGLPQRFSALRSWFLYPSTMVEYIMYTKVSLQEVSHNFSIPIFQMAFPCRQACLFDKAMIDIDFSRSAFDNVPAVQLLCMLTVSVTLPAANWFARD